MKQETNNEIDLLLRRLGRQPDLSAPGAGLSLDEDHLDADELSAYAENALPDSARARYTEHIADCSRCRELVVGLSSSVGVVRAADAVKAVESSALRRFLTGLFSPMVLRYSIPALGVLVVMAIGFVVLRNNNRRAESVVQLSEADQKKVAASEQPQASSGFLNNSAEPVAKPTSETTTSRGAPAGVAAPPPNMPPGVSSVDAEVKPAAAAPKPEEQPAAANEPAPPKVGATTDQTQTVTVEAKKQTIDNRTLNDLPVQKPAGLAKDQVRRDETAAVAEYGAGKSKSESEVSTASARRARANVARDGVDKDSKEDEAETRSVAGRRFRKERGVWVDTAYEESRGLMNLPRGSEQFRALVADEPAIKTIADQLDGEIIVVWKGRAYRIR